MRLGRGLIGNAVVSINDGRELGEVRDLYLDSDLKSVVGIHLGSKGLLKRTPQSLKSSDVAVFGIDAVLAKGTAAVLEGELGPEAGPRVRLSDLRGREASTPGGTKIGRIEDVILDETAQVVGFSLGHLSVEGPVAESKSVARTAVVDTGGEGDAMTINLAQAERESLIVDPASLFSEQAAEEVSEASDVASTGG